MINIDDISFKASAPSFNIKKFLLNDDSVVLPLSDKRLLESWPLL